MNNSKRFISFFSVFFVLAIISISFYGAQGVQATKAATQHTPLLIPPPPSAPYWTYKTSNYVEAVAVSADGSTIVAGTLFDGVYVFGRQSNTTLWIYKSLNAITRNVAVSANGSTIVVGDTYGYDNTFAIRAFGRASNVSLWTYEAGGYANSVAVSADGSTIVSGGSAGIILAFSRLSNTTLWTYDTSDWLFSVAVSANGSTIVSGGGDFTIRVFSRQSNTTLWTYTAPAAINGVAVSSDGNTIVSGATDGVIRVFSRESNTTLWTYNAGGYGKIVYGVGVSGNGTTIAAGGLDHHLRVFGRTNNTTLIDHDTGGNIYRTVAVSSDGSTIVGANSAGVNSKAFLYSKSLGQLWNYTIGANMGDQPDSGPDAGISADGSIAAYGSDDHTIYVFQYELVPPVFGSPSVLPLSPVGGQSVDISVAVTDVSGISTVTFYYKIAGSDSWSSVIMSLTGGVYKATVGPFSSGDNVYYYFNGTDTIGNRATSPDNAPTGFYSLAIGQAPAGDNLTTFVLIGVGAGAAVTIAIALYVMKVKGKKGRQ